MFTSETNGVLILDPVYIDIDQNLFGDILRLNPLFCI